MDIFTAISPASTIRALWDHSGCVEQPGKQHRVVTIVENANSVTLPVEVALDVTAEVLRFLMDEEDARNRGGLMLCEFLGDADETELRRILSRITGPEGSTFTNP